MVGGWRARFAGTFGGQWTFVTADARPEDSNAEGGDDDEHERQAGNEGGVTKGQVAEQR